MTIELEMVEIWFCVSIPAFLIAGLFLHFKKNHTTINYDNICQCELFYFYGFKAVWNYKYLKKKG